MVVLQWVLIVLSVALIVMLVIQTRKRARALDERIEEYREEQEAAKSQPGPINPYQDLGNLIHPDREPPSDNQEK
jgi:type II secretory pathway pseudopilin PulG